MSLVYLIRHGQAGTRQNYDTLSSLGKKQARLLGEYLVAQGVVFHAVYSGGMSRQQQTADAVAAAYEAAGIAFPPVTTHEAWREFDLDHIYKAMAPQLCATDAAFRVAYEAMREEARRREGDETADVHRRWTPCDIQIVEAWLHGRVPYEGESWTAFQQRVGAAELHGDDEDAKIAVFTSATPAAIWAGRGLDVQDTRALRIASVLHNASFTLLRVRGEQLRLFSLNESPHLPRPEWRTHR
ncbi:MAG TPA: histidine phosphatase family protein [Bryobacteraceae bacterium]|nr:histidine phosphatase family protein [Bryobacteraceae bacterium]